MGLQILQHKVVIFVFNDAGACFLNFFFTGRNSIIVKFTSCSVINKKIYRVHFVITLDILLLVYIYTLQILIDRIKNCQELMPAMLP